MEENNSVQKHRKITKFNITDTLLSMPVKGGLPIKSSEATTEQVRNSISRLKKSREKARLSKIDFECTSVREKMPHEFRDKCNTYVTRIS